MQVNDLLCFCLHLALKDPRWGIEIIFVSIHFSHADTLSWISHHKQRAAHWRPSSSVALVCVCSLCTGQICLSMHCKNLRAFLSLLGLLQVLMYAFVHVFYLHKGKQKLLHIGLVTYHQASEQLCLNTQRGGRVLILETSERILGKERGRASSICRTDCDLNRQLYGAVCECVCVLKSSIPAYWILWQCSAVCVHRADILPRVCSHFPPSLSVSTPVFYFYSLFLCPLMWHCNRKPGGNYNFRYIFPR